METALTAALKSGHAIIITRLLNAGADVNAADRDLGCALHGALSHDFPDVAEILLTAGAQPHPCLDRSGCRGPLHVAAYRGFANIVDTLIRRGANVNAHAGWRTPLILASEWGHKCVVRRLLAAGADVNDTDEESGCALHGALGRGHTNVAKLLLSAGAEPNTHGGLHGAPLQAAAYRGLGEAVKLLLDDGADVHQNGGLSGNALNAGSSEGHLMIVNQLLIAGADVNDMRILDPP